MNLMLEWIVVLSLLKFKIEIVNIGMENANMLLQ
jgi:hypothetical protein